MAVVIPSIFTPVHDEETQKHTSTNEESVRKIIHDTNYLSNLLPLGQIIQIQINQVGVPVVDSNVWQLCDGSEIVNPLSLLRTIGINQRFTPDFPDTFIRGAPATTGNASGGSQFFPLDHGHFGGTGFDSPSGSVVYEEDGDPGARRYRESHGHGMVEGYRIGNITIDFPKWFKVAPFMKIQ
jgi:hypothetical protein